ncbi:uncharacterized protein RCC_02381 [Ramularia collo-cygni]|uniref:Amidase domain-containing protein n=1 Tax=Ramularia collo-cygni TaxID=112498 RepID=A0A2D3UWF2_9PEZI|nr:uncharacterized protein RCC_02381 [Ramularia collo-cygni]CZT16547.1 uncharacterized protein RCC_02381 [Ramularia collo-cygni]
MEREYAQAIKRLGEAEGITVQHPITIQSLESLQAHDADWVRFIAFREARSAVDEYCSLLDSGSIHSMADIRDWNENHADVVMPPGSNQNDISSCLSLGASHTVEQELNSAKASARRIAACEGLDKVYAKYDINLIAAPGDSFVYCHAAAAGYPMISMPLSTLEYNGRPHGLSLIAQASHEALLIRFMETFHKVFPARPEPPLRG